MISAGGEMKTLETAPVTMEHTRDLYIEDKMLVTQRSILKMLEEN